jgi:DNA-directed RNA polymerase subunit E'/Rpb7
MSANVRMTLFKPVYIDQRVSLTPMEFREAAADIDTFLLKKIQKNVEGQCCTHGFVRDKSMQIMARSMGQAEHCRFTGDFLYYCKVKIDCLLLHEGQIVGAQILKMNKMGAYALLTDGGSTIEAVRVLLPRDLHMGNVAFDSLQVGANIQVRILRSRFQTNDAFIQAVGLFESLASTASTAPLKPLLPAVPATDAAA